LLEAIESQRREVVGKVIAVLNELLVSLRDGPDRCSFECSSIQLGALTKEMRAKGLDLKPESSPLGYSAVATMDAARSIRSPRCLRQKKTPFGFVGHCDLGSLIQSNLFRLEETLDGLTLDDLDGRCLLGHPRLSLGVERGWK
jgi:hypothetical protein